MKSHARNRVRVDPAQDLPNRPVLSGATFSKPQPDSQEGSTEWDEFQAVGNPCPPLEDESEAHDLEREVQRALTNQPGLSISSLVVRRVEQGVCVQGVMDANRVEIDVCRLIRDITGIENVINRVLVRKPSKDARHD